MIDIEKLYYTNKNKLNWKNVERDLTKYLNCSFANENTSKTIIIDKIAVDELTHSKYNMKLVGKLRLIKANLCMHLESVIREMENERWKEDIGEKHKSIAKNGWFRYDIHFTYPIRDEMGNYIGKQNYKATVVVRCAEDDKMYLYDIIDIKK